MGFDQVVKLVSLIAGIIGGATQTYMSTKGLVMMIKEDHETKNENQESTPAQAEEV